MPRITDATLTPGSASPLALTALIAGALLLSATATHAAASPEAECQKGQYATAAKYGACQHKALAGHFGGSSGSYEVALGKCQAKFLAVWAKLQAKASGSGATCDSTRFTDNGTTVTDNLTGLQWEKKTDDASIHDKDNVYSWSVAQPYTAADGSAFTVFLPALNSGGCFAGQCDWRLPTIYELQTILRAPYVCAAHPCIDPIFGPTVAGPYWSATTYVLSSNEAWDVSFLDGGLYPGNGVKFFNYAVRAVRAGL